MCIKQKVKTLDRSAQRGLHRQLDGRIHHQYWVDGDDGVGFRIFRGQGEQKLEGIRMGRTRMHAGNAAQDLLDGGQRLNQPVVAPACQGQAQRVARTTFAAWTKERSGYNNPTQVVKRSRAFRRSYQAKASTPRNNPNRIAIVLEDYHTLEAPAVDQALMWLLEHQPLALRLIITSCEDPPLPLARLRARGQLTELRGADLRFAPREAGALIQHLTGLPLSDTQAETLVARTEGWAAGLQLASLALRETSDIDSLITSLRGTHRLIIDYLTNEVLL